MALAEVVMLREEPPLNDIAACLRRMADRIERGELMTEAAYVVCVDPDEFAPMFHGFGNVADRHGIAGLFHHIAHLALMDAEPD